MSIHRTQATAAAILLIPIALACRDRAGSVDVATPAGAVVSASVPATSTDSAVGSHASDAPVSYADAEQAFQRRSYGEASQLFDSYRRQHADNPWGHYMYGLSAWRAGSPQDAMTGFDEALRLDPDHRKSLFNSARVLLETGQPGQALERIERALSLEPLSAEGHRLLGRARVELGQFDEAIDAYQRAITIDDRDVWSMNNLGLLYIQQGQSEDALLPLARAVELRSDSPVFQNNLGTALERTGHVLEAKQAYEAAVTADSGYTKAVSSLARITPLVQPGDTSTIDLAEASREFQAEVSRLRDTAVGQDSVTVQASAGETPPDSSAR
ncbi:MAG TPA: tetratricopeptide repeat protein [Gemmatimonadales bacterium]|nr:tetratricopeptide repeat protein [Gemmatimonadales bacterium]